MPDSVLHSLLPHAFHCPSTGTRWQLKANDYEETASRIATIIMEKPESLRDGAFLKTDRRRMVFRLSTPKGSLVTKAMPLDSLKARLRPHRYAPSEAAHLAEAARRGLPVPALLGLGESRRFGLVRWNAVLMEFLPHLSMREAFLSKPTAQETWALLLRALPLLRQLYLAGCNHIDFGPHAILLGPEETSPDDRLIDFQYCRFHDHPRPATLAAQAGYFAWAVSTNRNWVSMDTMERWFDEVLKACDLSPRREPLLPLFRRASRRRASMDARLNQ